MTKNDRSFYSNEFLTNSSNKHLLRVLRERIESIELDLTNTLDLIKALEEKIKK